MIKNIPTAVCYRRLRNIDPGGAGIDITGQAHEAVSLFMALLAIAIISPEYKVL